MSMKSINLGRKIEPIETIEDVSEKVPDMVYPSLYLSDREGLENAPEVGSTGKAMVEFKVISKTKSERENKTNISTDLEIMSIQFMESSMSEDEDEDEIERGLRESEEEMDSEDEDEED